MEVFSFDHLVQFHIVFYFSTGLSCFIEKFRIILQKLIYGNPKLMILLVGYFQRGSKKSSYFMAIQDFGLSYLPIN